MNLILIPTIVSVVALGLLVVAAGVGTLLTLDAGSAATGRAFRRRALNAVAATLVFAWAGPMLAVLPWALAGHTVPMAVIWVSGPLGLVVGFLWPLREGRGGAGPPPPENPG